MDEVHDFRLVAARRLIWDEERCRNEPAHLGLVIRTLEDMLAAEPEDPQVRAELPMLIKKLREAAREPRLA